MKEIKLKPTNYDKHGEPMYTLEDLAKQLKTTPQKLVKVIEKLSRSIENLGDFHDEVERKQ